MANYTIKRLMLAVPTIFLVALMAFSLIRIVPGDIIAVMMQDMREYDAGATEDLKRQLGIDKPIYAQFGNYLWDLTRLDMGESLWNGDPVFPTILKRLPITLELGIMAIVFSAFVALPVGVISAIRQDTFMDYGLRAMAIIFLTIPSFAWATLAVVLPALWWSWVPPVFYTKWSENPWDHISQFFLPALILGGILSGTVMRMTRTMMLEVLRQDYIRTAWAKGLPERTVIVRHAVKNAFIPVLTIMGLQVAFLIGGSVIMETVFALPGMGRLLIEVIENRDYPIIQGIVLFIGIFVIFVNLVVDLAYGWLDPRIRFAN
jgi:peptide/nickel transport system permease protein